MKNDQVHFYFNRADRLISSGRIAQVKNGSYAKDVPTASEDELQAFLAKWEADHAAVMTKDMLDLAKHIVNSKTTPFEPEKFEDHYEAALIDLINKKRNGQAITPKARPAGGNVVNLIDALRASLGQEQASKPAKKPKKAADHKEMLLPIEGKKPAKEGTAKKTASKPQTQVSLANNPGYTRFSCGYHTHAGEWIRAFPVYFSSLLWRSQVEAHLQSVQREPGNAVTHAHAFGQRRLTATTAAANNIEHAGDYDRSGSAAAHSSVSHSGSLAQMTAYVEGFGCRL
jgi:hypothetical protein